jgi:hypothetical protein
MTEVTGLQLARNDKAAASGLMTEARQRRALPRVQHRLQAQQRNGDPSVDAKHFTLATFPAKNPQCSIGKVLFEPFALPASRVP